MSKPIAEVAFVKANDFVAKVGGDYRFEGQVLCVFKKLSGATRLVVEDDRGVVHIFNPTQVRLIRRGDA